MPTWGAILEELATTVTPQGAPDFDGVRRKYLRQLHAHTGRAVILYASAFLESKPAPATDLVMNPSDVQGLLEATSDLQERELDLILHSPGGLTEAAESVVYFLRSRFDHIRAIVPYMAMSGATMVALAADEIVMAAHSQLGPIDPVFLMPTAEGPRGAPAQVILDQFEQAKRDCQDLNNLAAWVPILRMYGPGLLAQCRQQQELAVDLVSRWLAQHMFAGQADAQTKAQEVAAWFSNYAELKSQARPIRLEQLQALGLKATKLESDPQLQDAVMSVHHATQHTLMGSRAVKIIENHNGRAYVKLAQAVTPPPGAAPSAPQPPLSRAERRRQQRQR